MYLMSLSVEPQHDLTPIANEMGTQNGAVNLFLTGGWDYNLDGLNSTQLTQAFAVFDSKPNRPGIWTIPVCSGATRFDVLPQVVDGKPQLSGNRMANFMGSKKGKTGHNFRFQDCMVGIQHKDPVTGANVEK